MGPCQPAPLKHHQLFLCDFLDSCSAKAVPDLTMGFHNLSPLFLHPLCHQPLLIRSHLSCGHRSGSCQQLLIFCLPHGLHSLQLRTHHHLRVSFDLETLLENLRPFCPFSFPLHCSSSSLLSFGRPHASLGDVNDHHRLFAFHMLCCFHSWDH